MKKNLFVINENERSRILNMHETATKNNYVFEQEEPVQYYKDQNKYYAGDGIGTIEEVTDRLSLVLKSLL